MNDKQKIGIAVAAIIVVIVIIILAQQAATPATPPTPQGVQPPAPSPTGAVPLPGTTREEIKPGDVPVIPEQGAKNIPEEIAVPKVVTEARPESTAKLRTFDIKAANDSFNPNSIIVKKGDTVHIKITAVDKDYDFTQPDYGYKKTILKGQTQVVEFSATAQGKFTYFCASCGGIESGAAGFITVVP